MKKILLKIWGYNALILMLFCGESLHAIPMGGAVKKTIEWCKQGSNLASMLMSVQNMQIPVNGGMGVTMGWLQTTNPIVDYCDFVISLERMEVAESIEFAAHRANNLFELKADEELGVMRDIYDLSNTAFNFKSGKFNVEKMYTPNFVRRLDMLTRRVGDLHDDKYISSYKDAWNIRTKQEREQELRRLGEIASRKKALEENLACSNIRELRSVDYEKIAKDVSKYNLEAQAIERSVLDYRRILMGMAIPLASIGNTTKDHQEYRIELIALIEKGLEFKVSDGVWKLKTKERVPLKENKKLPNGADDPKAPKTEAITKTVEQRYQKVAVNVDTSLLNTFIESWSPRWKKYVEVRLWTDGKYSLSDGGRDSRTKRIEEEFLGYSDECTHHAIVKENNLDVEDPDFHYQMRDLKAECQKRAIARMKDAKGIFEYSANKYWEEAKKHREILAKIYTLESQHLGISRTFSITKVQDKTWEDEYPKTQIDCAENPSFALQLRKQQEIEKNILDSTLLMAETTLKANIREERKDEEERERIKKEAIRREQEKHRDEMYSTGNEVYGPGYSPNTNPI